MISPRSPHPGLAKALATSLILAASLGAGSAQANALNAYYERTVMAAANDRCRLFTPALASALAASQAQARGAALRAGASRAAVSAAADRARLRVGVVGCASPDVIKAAIRVRTAFNGYSHMQRMNFPGDTAGWNANRGVSRLAPVWKLSQAGRLGDVNLTFGLAGQGEARTLVAVADLSDPPRPYAARLVMRDLSLAPEPYLNAIDSHGAGPLPLEARMPPRSATRGILADGRGPADLALLPAGAKSGYAFRFPAAAIDALAALDPREAVAIEFLFGVNGRDAVRTAYVEVGDFAAGRAFLTTAQR